MSLLNKIIIKYPTLILLTLFLTNTIRAQNIVLYPSELITPWYNFDEWIYTNANWSFDSYDLANYEPFSKFYSSPLEMAPKIFIDDQLYITKWLDQDIIGIPNLSIEYIDSIVISSNKRLTNGYFTPNGSIEVFLKNEASSILLEKNLVNQINDPGPHLSSELRTPNIEFVSLVDRYSINVPSFLNTRLLYSGSIYSRTNIFTYDRKRTGYLYDRTNYFKSPGNQRYQRNIERDIIMLNSFTFNKLDIQLTSSYSYYNQFYQWFPLTGIEIPAKHKKMQSSILISPIDNSIFKKTQFSFSHASTDTLAGVNVSKYGVTETILSHSSSFDLFFKQTEFELFLKNHSYFWNDQATGVNKSLHDINLILAYTQSSLEKINFIFGNYTLGFDYKKTLAPPYSLSISTFRRDLRANGYNFNFWNDGISFADLNKAEHTVVNRSDFINTYSIAEIGSKLKNTIYDIKWTVFSKHYWEFVHTNIDYAFNNSNLQLKSDITYTDLKNVGFVGFDIFVRSNPLNKTYLNSSLSGHIFRYGNNNFISTSKNITQLLFSQSIQYRADKNAIFEFVYKYVSPRDIVEFEHLESNPIFTTSHIRPIHLLNATAKTWMFDRSLALTLALRNLLNSTESYNTNGQYYNMSIFVSASLRIGKKS
jgi:hypothetical protein